MTIVRSLGVTTLVALMSAHRTAAELCGTDGAWFDQAAVEAIEAYLRDCTRCGDRAGAGRPNRGEIGTGGSGAPVARD